MANSALINLPTLTAASVNNVSSLFFFVSNNDNGRLMSGEVLQSYIHNANTTILNKTSVQTFTGGANEYWDWDEAIRDPWSMWDANSVQMVTIPWNGYVQFRFRSESNNGGGTYAFTNVVQGNSGSASPPGGGGLWCTKDQITGYRDSALTAPVPVSSGDQFRLRSQYQTTNQGVSNQMRAYLEVIPLKVYA